MSDVPEGFEPLFRTSPFLEANGPFYQRQDGRELIIGLRIAPQHTNARGFAHGGILMTMADIALGYNIVLSQDQQVSWLTTNMSVDFASSAKIGDWVEVRVDIQKVGSRVAFANAYIHVGEERIVRASAVFVSGNKSGEKKRDE